eukprot:GFYU01003814.1.p1 GENE.GFYU01003814.1~~GFYU01003814.1.p1  ORF type:complete len:819 (-),score=269.28 GFYU01003814.1:92-2548(-)
MGCGASTTKPKDEEDKKKNEAAPAPKKEQPAPAAAEKPEETSGVEGREASKSDASATSGKARFKSAVQATKFVQTMVKATVTKDMRVAIEFSKDGDVDDIPDDDGPVNVPEEKAHSVDVPPLNIVIMIVGTQGDVQPFIALSKELKTHGHRVRLATHACFREFVTKHGVEFYPLGGDPHQLAAYMVKNEGFIPGSVAEVQEKRNMIQEIVESTWGACTMPDGDGPPFVAEAIISNPSTFGHIHVAEKLCVPLHMFFTMPWTPTRAFPHPLANISYARDPGYENKLSYNIVDSLMWSGMADIFNKFRTDTLGLDPIYAGSGGANILNDNLVPFAYIWSPSIIPKPEDWGNYIDVVGFFFLNQASSYEPPQDLKDFLDAGPPPIFIGFGSCAIEEGKNDKVTGIIYDTVKELGCRAIVQKGWAKLGGGHEKPDSVYLADQCPHDWLFPRVSAVCHHGGAGTCAAGLRNGKPTIIVPFCGDQPFWGQMVANQKAGPTPIPIDTMTKEKLTEAFSYVLGDEAKANAERIAASMATEDGIKAGVEAFHKRLPVDTMVCDLEPKELAVKYCEDCDMKMSEYADRIIHEDGSRKNHKRGVYRYVAWGGQIADHVAEGLMIGTGAALEETVGGITGIFSKPIEGAKAGGVKGAAKGVGEGLVGAVAGPLKGGVIFLEKVSEGLHNTPDALGGQDGTKSPEADVKHVGDGVKQGGIAFGKGIYDGITGLFLRPIEGGKEAGAIGVAKGLGQGLAGLVCKPAAGAIDFFTKTARGVQATPGHLFGDDKDEKTEEEILHDEERKRAVMDRYQQLHDEHEKKKQELEKAA